MFDFKYVFPASIAGLVILTQSVSAASQTPAPDTCAELLELSAQTCTARVTCPTGDLLPKEAETLYLGCRNGTSAPRSRLDALLEGYGDARTYACCVGTALHTRYGAL